jgi:hypothetical protein
MPQQRSLSKHQGSAVGFRTFWSVSVVSYVKAYCLHPLAMSRGRSFAMTIIGKSATCASSHDWHAEQPEELVMFMAKLLGVVIWLYMCLGCAALAKTGSLGVRHKRYRFADVLAVADQ